MIKTRHQMIGMPMMQSFKEGNIKIVWNVLLQKAFADYSDKMWMVSTAYDVLFSLCAEDIECNGRAGLAIENDDARLVERFKCLW